MKTTAYVLAALIGCWMTVPARAGLLDEERDELWWAEKHWHRQQQMLRMQSRQGENLRLSGDIVPINYNLVLTPNFNTFRTDGHIEITMTCVRTTVNITMNAAELVMDASSVVEVVDITNQTNIVLSVRDFVDEQNSTETITIQLGSQLLVGRQYKVTLRFVSILNDALRGFYRSSYEENGVKKYLAVSQMEAPDARRAFPCFDEPGMKATFTVALGHFSNMTAISNMPRTNSIVNPVTGVITDFFQTSVKMSTYLVAMMVSEFVGISSDTSLEKVKFTIWSRPSYSGQTKYAGNIGPRVLEFFENYFAIDYPLPKQDMAAIPDFAAGAMENWGLITYREADLLFDDLRSSEAAKQRVAEVVAHELAHQWFGNLVTMEWWNVIWLNEGFARYMQYVGAHAVEPSFRMSDQFGIVTTQGVFELDSLESSRPINAVVNTIVDINAMFDSISYNKGACLLRMCANFVGLETFEKGVTRYLEKNAYGNTVQDDLWTALQAQVDADLVSLPVSVKQIMDTWTEKMGYPLITVTRNYNQNTVQLTQQRFLLRKSGAVDTTVYRWWVPLTYTSNFNQAPVSMWMTNAQDSGSISNLAADDTQWIMFNVDQVGYYRVKYDDTNYGLILDQLMRDHNAIPVVNRAQLIDDSLNIARTGSMPYSQAMELTKYLKHEHDYVPWAAADRTLDYIDTMLYGQNDYNEWNIHMSALVNQLYDHVGFTASPADAHLFIYARSVAVSWACLKLDNAECIQKAKANYGSWMANPSNNTIVSPNLRRLVACTSMAFGGQAEWNFGYQQYMASTFTNEKTDLLRAITCSRTPAIINNMLNMMINSTSGIRLQDVNTFFSNIASNPVAHEYALDFLINRWDDVMKYLNDYKGFGGGSITNMFRALCNRINTRAKLNKLIKLRDDHTDVLGSSKPVAQGVEVAQANVAWVDKNYADVTAWLKTQNSSSATGVRHSFIFVAVAIVGQLMLY